VRVSSDSAVLESLVPFPEGVLESLVPWLEEAAVCTPDVGVDPVLGDADVGVDPVLGDAAAGEAEATCSWLAMDSPQMYDLSEAAVKPAGKPSFSPPGGDLADLADLTASEVSLDLQAFVSDPHFSDAIFPDITAERVGSSGGGGSSLPYSLGSGYLPPPQQISVVKKDPDAAYRPPAQAGYPTNNFYNNCSPAYTSLTPASTLVTRPAATPTLTRPAAKSSGAGHKKSGSSDRASDEYRRRRERNNVAVRRSREKAKVRSRETEDRVKTLSRENDGLHKRIEILSKELGVLKNLFSNVGVLPDQLHREIAKHLGEGFNGRSLPSNGL